MEERKVKVITLRPWEVPPVIRKQMADFMATTGEPVDMAYEPFFTTGPEDVDEQ